MLEDAAEKRNPDGAGGRAPSPELRAIFNRFKSWLVSIYRTLTQLHVTLTDVRGVMDRLVASDAQIEAAWRKRKSCR